MGTERHYNCLSLVSMRNWIKELKCPRGTLHHTHLLGTLTCKCRGKFLHKPKNLFLPFLLPLKECTLQSHIVLIDESQSGRGEEVIVSNIRPYSAACSYIQCKQLVSVGLRISTQKFYCGHIIESVESSGSTME